MQCMEDTDNPRKCHLHREDYLECLHHRKEVMQQRADQIFHSVIGRPQHLILSGMSQQLSDVFMNGAAVCTSESDI